MARAQSQLAPLLGGAQSHTNKYYLFVLDLAYPHSRIFVRGVSRARPARIWIEIAISGPCPCTNTDIIRICLLHCTYLTPTDGLKGYVGLESWGCLHSKALIKLEKTREEPKSSEAGERKELMLKSKTLESICWSFGFFGDAYSWE